MGFGLPNAQNLCQIDVVVGRCGTSDKTIPITLTNRVTQALLGYTYIAVAGRGVDMGRL